MNVLSITPNNVNLLNNLNKQRATVLIYHPSCIHCMMMRNNWEQMKQKLHKKNCNIYEVNAEHIDRESHPITRQATGFPTIMNIKNGKVMNHFEKERNVDNMMKFVLSNTPNSPDRSLSQKVVDNRRLKFSLNNNGSLLKQRKVLNGKLLKDSIAIRKKTLKNKKNNKKGKTGKKNPIKRKQKRGKTGKKVNARKNKSKKN